MAVNDSIVPTPIRLEDVGAYFNICSDSFGQLAAILAAIKKSAGDDRHMANLADAGAYIASDMENAADCYREDVLQNGVRHE
jgi:hypothetical protein